MQLVWLATLLYVYFFLSIVAPEENTDVNTSLINDKPTRKIGTNNNLDFALRKYSILWNRRTVYYEIFWIHISILYRIVKGWALLQWVSNRESIFFFIIVHFVFRSKCYTNGWITNTNRTCIDVYTLYVFVTSKCKIVDYYVFPLVSKNLLWL